MTWPSRPAPAVAVGLLGAAGATFLANVLPWASPAPCCRRAPSRSSTWPSAWRWPAGSCCCCRSEQTLDPPTWRGHVNRPAARGRMPLTRSVPELPAVRGRRLAAAGRAVRIVTSRNLVHAITCCRWRSPPPTSCCCRSASSGAARRRSSSTCPSAPRPSTRSWSPHLTDIVVGATVSALLLALAVQAYKHHGSLDPERLGREQD